MIMEYSAGLTSKLFWLQEARKTASYIADGLSKSEIRAIAWDENIYQVRAEYRAYEVLNGTYRRVSLLPMDLLKAFLSCDIETAKVLNHDFDIDGQPFVFLNLCMKCMMKSLELVSQRLQTVI